MIQQSYYTVLEYAANPDPQINICLENSRPVLNRVVNPYKTLENVCLVTFYKFNCRRYDSCAPHTPLSVPPSSLLLSLLIPSPFDSFTPCDSDQSTQTGSLRTPQTVHVAPKALLHRTGRQCGRALLFSSLPCQESHVIWYAHHAAVQGIGGPLRSPHKTFPRHHSSRAGILLPPHIRLLELRQSPVLAFRLSHRNHLKVPSVSCVGMADFTRTGENFTTNNLKNSEITFSSEYP